MSASTVREEEVRGRLRRRRADAGSVRLSNRDSELLRLVGEQYAVSVEQLARLIGRTSRTGRWLRDRWRAAGWIESRQLAAAGPSLLWLTGSGARVCGSPYRLWRPNAALANHVLAVVELRLLLERELSLGRWICERSLAQNRRRMSPDDAHLPDALLKRAPGPVAIEVELTQKSRARLAAIVEQLSVAYSEVWYFAAPPAAPSLYDLAAEAPLQNVRVCSYPPRLAEICAR